MKFKIRMRNLRRKIRRRVRSTITLINRGGNIKRRKEDMIHNMSNNGLMKKNRLNLVQKKISQIMRLKRIYIRYPIQRQQLEIKMVELQMQSKIKLVKKTK